MDDIFIQRLLTWLNGGQAAPYKLELRPTDRCNLSCLSCHQRRKEEGSWAEELTRDEYVKLIQDAGELGIRLVEIVGGGESMARPDLTMAIMEEVKRQGIYGSMTTNGTLFSETQVEQVVRMGWDLIVISLDGPDAETHDYLRRVPGTFDRVMEFIDRINHWKKELGSEVPHLGFTPVLCNRNHDKLPAMVELARRNGVERLIVKPLYVHTEMAEALQLDEQNRAVVASGAGEALELARAYDMETNLESILDANVVEMSAEPDELIRSDLDAEGRIDHPFLNIGCYLPWFYMVMEVDGTIGACTTSIEFEGTEHIRDKSLREIWYGSQFETFRQGLLGDDLPPCCAKCCGGIILNNRQVREWLSPYLEAGGGGEKPCAVEDRDGG